jgi:hypothetical protein
MTTAMSVFNTELPDYLKNTQSSELTKSLAGNINKRLSIRGGVFRMIVGGEEVRKAEGRELKVIIVNAAPKVSRIFYKSAFDMNNTTAPDCWSAEGVAPDSDVENKQGNTCMDCPQNIKGSSRDGKGRACSFQRRLAVLIVGDPTGDVFQLTLPSQSIFAKNEGDNLSFDQYVKLLIANGRSIESMVTELSFDTDSATPKLFFKPVSHLTREQYDMATKAGKSEAAIRAIKFTVAKTDGVAKEQAKLAAPQEEAAPQAEAAPKKRESKKAEAPPAPKQDLSEIMKEWS